MAPAADHTSTTPAPGHGLDDGTVLISTTFPRLPLPANDARSHIHTARLLVRPLQQSDLAGLHALRSQPEAMTGTRLGRPDQDLAETQTELDFFLGRSRKAEGEEEGCGNPSTYLWGAFLQSTGELIGEGGVHTLVSDDAVAGWPEIGYKFRKEHWGHGYATEFLDAVLGGLVGAAAQCGDCEVTAAAAAAVADGDVSGVDGSDDVAAAAATEHVYANAEPSNVGSCRVLEKLGFRRFHAWTEPDTQLHRIGEPLHLAGYLLASPGPSCANE
ncbi:GNAT domain-containing protein [Apiospora kogelbergensis]|uniref:GNAT domain-containing protein n=1 Tax=Apiospora kogelbergensis TaxID=1337665 RepID=UPI0031318D4B